MKVQLESTTKVVSVSGVEARIWEGHTESGIAVHAYIARIAVRSDADQSQFERELLERRAPSPHIATLLEHQVL